jgi:WhiB family redox-sensing transcriptional regulator
MAKYTSEPTNEPDYWNSVVIERVFVTYPQDEERNRAPYHYHRSPICPAMTRNNSGPVFEVNLNQGDRHTYIAHQRSANLYVDVEPCSQCKNTEPSYGLRYLMRRGKCHVAGLNVSDLFFAKYYGGNPSEDAKRALGICAMCPVKQECRDYADRTEQEFGIWGGEPAHERKGRWDAKAGG